MLTPASAKLLVSMNHVKLNMLMDWFDGSGLADTSEEEDASCGESYMMAEIDDGVDDAIRDVETLGCVITDVEMPVELMTQHNYLQQSITDSRDIDEASQPHIREHINDGES